MDSLILKALKAYIDYATQKNETTVHNAFNSTIKKETTILNVIIRIRQQLDKNMGFLVA